MNKEIWKLVAGTRDKYAVSNYGRLKRVVSGQSTCPNYILSQKIGVRGYCCHSGLGITHRLVLEAFIGVCPEGKECNHKDGNKLNNRLENLEWVTRSENIKHAYKLGLKKRPSGESNPMFGVHLGGERNPRAVLTLRQVNEIRRQYVLGKVTQKILAERFDVSGSAVWNIVNNHTWRCGI